ncbi:hypothetical protein [Anaerovorax sp. IOR16]|uniref:hypothetical protein n=1 Tax=Anaerovorax sp. IOR16 TaxID=2773458 RepID=UPI0019D0B38A|nr:hypothetical protein [Anaerovorax sp. IOR16]
MDIVRCNWCEHIYIDSESAHCPVCERNDCIVDLDGTEKYTDKQLELLWEIFGDIPMNPETEEIEDDFLYFPINTHREEIWYWFDENHSKGVGWLMNEYKRI